MTLKRLGYKSFLHVMTLHHHLMMNSMLCVANFFGFLHVLSVVLELLCMSAVRQVLQVFVWLRCRWVTLDLLTTNCFITMNVFGQMGVNDVLSIIEILGI